ncbi:L-methionine/branched-chain amino acid transporter [Anaerosinus massiliensis]|uniref:L-methionine/branched-chain amino acid transporter n=1 Tax=Massilibacillus massiliensis TaxID=1806837 RepID=UPI000DA63458|nr:L-methionine/branched-chain amino acid transporter [Massilibacillus massiliensis]
MQKRIKSLNVYQGVGVLVSTLLGSSIFVIPAMAADLAGEKSVIAWLLTILCVIPVAFTFSSLGVKYPNEGGTAYFIKKSFGEKFGKFTSWLYLSALPICPPIIVITGANYIGAIWGADQWQVFFICIVMLIGLFCINLYGLEFASKMQTFISVLVVGILMTLIFLAAAKVNLIAGVAVHLNFSDISVLKTTISLIFWCFVGIEAVVHIASDFKSVERDFPITILISLCIVGSICILLSLIVLKFHTYGSEALNANYIVALFSILIGESGKIFVAIMAFFTALAAANLYLVSFAKMIYAMSITGDLSKTFRTKNKNGMPVHALLACYGLSILTIVMKYILDINLEQLIFYANSVFIAIYLLASIAGIVLLSGGKRYLAVISTIFCSVIFVSLGWKSVYVIGVPLLFCAIQYFMHQKYVLRI